MAFARDTTAVAETNKLLRVSAGPNRTNNVTALTVSTDTLQIVTLSSCVAEIESVDVGVASGGTFTLTVGGQTTGNIDYDATAAVVDTAVTLLSTVVAVTVTGAGTIASPWLITFDDPVGPLTVTGTGTSLTPADSLTLTETTPGVDAIKEVATVDRGSASGGTFTLTVGGQETGNIAYDAIAATVDTAVQALSTVVATTVTGDGTGGDPWIITFDDPTGVLAVSGSGASLTPTDTLTVTETTPGVDAIPEVTTVDVGAATGGTFTITVDAQTTTGIDHDATAGTVDTAVAALSSVTAVTVTGTGSVADPWIITFDDPAGILAVSGTGTNLTPGDSLTVSESTAGASTALHILYMLASTTEHIVDPKSVFKTAADEHLAYTSSASGAVFVQATYAESRVL